MAGFGAKVKLTVDKSGRQEFNNQINSMVNQIKISNKFTVLQKDMDRVRREAQAMLNKEQIVLKVSKIDCSAAVADVKKQLQSALNTLSIANTKDIKGLKDALRTDGLDSDLRKITTAATDSAGKINEAKSATSAWTAQMKILDNVAKSLATTYRSGLSGKNMIADDDEIENITVRYNQWAQQLERLRALKVECSEEEFSALQNEGIAIQRLITARQNEQVAAQRAAAVKRAASEESQNALGQENDLVEKGNVLRRKAIDLLTRVQRYQRNWSAAEHGQAEYGYSKLAEHEEGLQKAIGILAKPFDLDGFNEAEKAFNDANIGVKEVANAINEAGENTKSFIDRMGSLTSKFSAWLTVSQVVMLAVRSTRNMVKSTIELDSAVTQLKIVTGATDREMVKFLTTATQLSKDLGKNITEMVSSIETFSRLGYNLSDSSTLAKFSAVLSNVAAVNVDEATTGLTSIIKGYNFDVSNAEHVANVLIEVGQKYAVSAGEMMEAYERAGAALNATNTSFEKSAGLIAAANAAVQDSSTVGTALKTISARIRGSKSELEELGENTEDLANGFSKYADELQKLTGFNIMVDGTTDSFKDIYDIFKGIAETWDSLSDTSQARVAEILGGTRQLQVITSVLSNWKDAAGAYEDAMNSAGVATKANAVYMDSVQSHINTFNAAFQELSRTTINSEFVKDIVDLGTALLEVLNTLSEINLLIPAIVAALATFKSFKMIESAENLAIKFINEKAATDSLLLSYKGLNAAQQERIRTTLAAAVSTEKLTKCEYENIKSQLKLATTTTGAKVATDGLVVSIKSLLSTNPLGWTLLAISMIPTVVNLIKTIHQSNEKLIQDAEDMKATYSETFSKMDSDLQTLHGLESEFERLSAGVDSYGNNISLSANEYERYQEIVETIVGISPELISGYNAEGKAIANKNGLLERSIKLMEQKQRLEYKEYYSDENFQKIAEGFVQKNRKSLETLSELPSKLQFTNVRGYIESAIGVKFDKWNDDLTSYIQRNADLIEENIAKIENTARNGFTDGSVKWGSLSEEKIAGLREYILSVVSAAKQATTELNQELQSAPLELSSYYKLSEAQKQFLSEYINTFRMTADTTAQDILKMKSDIQDFTDFLSGNEDLKNTIDIGISFRAGQDMEGNDLSVKEYEKQLENLLRDIDGFDKDVQVQLRTVLNIDESTDEIKSDIPKAIQHVKNLLQDEFDKNVDDLSIKEVLQIYYNISADPNNMTFEELQEKVKMIGTDWNTTVNVLDFSNLVNGLGNIESSISDVASAMNTLKSGTALTVEEMAKLALKYPDLMQASNLFTNTSIANQEQLLNTVLGSYESEYDALIDTKIAELEATNELIWKQVELENDKKNKVIEIADLQANGKLDSEAEYQLLLDELRDLEGKKFATYSNGILDVNKQMLEDMMTQQGESVEKSEPIWGALGDMIIEGHTDGLSGALNAFPQYRQKLANWATTSLGTLLGNMATNIKKALSGDTDFVDMTSGLQNIAEVSVNGVTIETKVEGNYTIDEQSVDEWAAGYKEAIEKRVKTISAQVTANKAIIDNLKSLKGLDLKSLYGSKSSSSSKGSSEQVEEYIADIDEYYQALKRLEAIQIRLSSLDASLAEADTDQEKIALTKQLVNVYNDEIETLEHLNSLRTITINNGIKELETLGFNISYNEKTNEFLVQNLEHLNELRGKTKKDTNELRENTEKLINTLDELNKANQDGVSSLSSYRAEIKSAKQDIIDYLNNIVTSASNAVDKIQNVYDTLKSAANEYAENGGFISVDAFQKIIELGPQYMQYLRDENGLLIINEENINKVIAAKTRQLAAEQAVTYVERLHMALQEGSIENINTLLYATTEATDATFGFAYAELALMRQLGEMDDQMYAAALHNIQAIESLANTAIEGIGQTAENCGDELEKMKTGIDDILKYVMDMLKHRIQQQVEALEGLKDAYGEIIDLRKEALDAAKQEAEYEDKVSEKVKQIAKLQERINALALDDSRDAQAQKVKLEEEMAELQKELADDQSDYAVDKQKETLDDMQKAYEKEKDAEIKALEETISSYQKLYDLAIDYISENWESLYDTLISWNSEYGSVLNSEITEAWNNCLAAAQRYGSYVSALHNIDADIAASKNSDSSNTNNVIVGTTGNISTSSREHSVRAIIKRMYQNMNEHGGAGSSTSSERKKILSEENLRLGNQLKQYGINADRSTNKEDYGTWYTDPSHRELLFEKYKNYIYHKGGIAGDNPTLKQNEVMAVLEKGEAVLDRKREQGLYRLVEFATTLSDKFSKLIKSQDMSNILSNQRRLPNTDSGIPANISNNQETRIEIGPTYIYGADNDTVEKHREVTRQFTNEILGKLNIKR